MSSKFTPLSFLLKHLAPSLGNRTRLFPILAQRSSTAMGDLANLDNVIAKEQLEQFGLQLLTKVEEQLHQAMH